MTGIWRVILFLYSLLLAAAGALVMILVLGRSEFMNYLVMAMTSPQNRPVIAGFAAVLLVLGIITLFYSLKSDKKEEPQAKSVIVTESMDGQVSMTIPAVKVIIMKAVKKVEGIREIKATVNSKPEGLDVLLHTMINPDYNVPEMSEKIQTAVKQQLESTGGLRVATIRVLIDDLGPSAK